MKVEVLQVEQATFKPYCYWSNWVDVAVYTDNLVPYLIQMRISRFNGKSFRSVNMIGRWTKSATAAEVGDLMPMGGK